MSSAARASVLMLTARASLLVLGFGNTVLTARLLQPEGRGAYASTMAALTLFTLTVGSVGNGVALSAAHDDEDTRRRAVTGSVGLAIGGGLLPLLVLVAWHPGGAWYVPALVAAASTPLVLLTNSAQFACLGRDRLGWVATLQLVQPALLVSLGAGLMLGLHAGLLGAMLAWTLSWAITSGIGLYVLAALGWRPRLAELPPWRSTRLMEFGVGASGYNLLSYFTNRSLLFLVQGLMGLGAAGVFSVAVTLAEPVSSMSVALSSAAYPRLVAAAGRPAEARRFLQLALVASLLGGTAILLLALLLLVPLFGSAYRGALVPLPFLLLAYVVLSGREIATLWYVHELKSYGIPIRASLVSFVATLGLALPLTARFGATGAAAGAVLGGLVMMTILLTRLRRRGLAWRYLLTPDPSLLGPLAAIRAATARGAPGSTD
jgi:O-antigen/teichoic acid export membrane protein